MRYFSTANSNNTASFKEAVLKGLASDKGLYFPERIPQLSVDFFEKIDSFSLQEIALEVIKPFVEGEIPDYDLQKIVNETLSFNIPSVEVSPNLYALELFHGPTCAFKDVGARFMARCFQYFLEKDEKQTILVATSGDTGSAVANGFLGIENIDVVVLYPKGKVSDIQECQFTTLGQNITALEIEGSFDDCQALVKEAFLDQEIQSVRKLSSANSINIARLLPQSFYYFYAYAQLKKHGKKLNICVPSGNFGNITGALLAKQMGLPIHNFIAALNSNRVFLDYIQTGEYHAKPSIQTIANAMDVGDPSNFVRVLELYGKSWEELKKEIQAASYSDAEINQAMASAYKETGYTLDPHGATGYLASQAYLKEHPSELVVFAETAHPAKFKETVEKAITEEVSIPESLQRFIGKEKVSIPMQKEYAGFKDFLLNI